MVAVDITPIFVEHLARNCGVVQGNFDVPQPPVYGVAASLDGGIIDLTLTFHAGSAYCCYEWGCHLALCEGKRWEWLRRKLAAAGATDQDRLELRLVVVVDAGALFYDWSRPLPSRRGNYAFAPVAAYRYQLVLSEGTDSIAELGGRTDHGHIN